MDEQDEKRLLNEILPAPEPSSTSTAESPRQRTISHLKSVMLTGLTLPIAACVHQVQDPPSPRPQAQPDPAPGGYQVVDALPPPPPRTELRPGLVVPGFLILRSTPVADIEIDGKPTGLKTPQENLSLPPGMHTIKLSADSLQQTFDVEIMSGKTASVERDLRSEPTTRPK